MIKTKAMATVILNVKVTLGHSDYSKSNAKVYFKLCHAVEGNVMNYCPEGQVN